MIVDGVRSLSGAVGGAENENFSHTKPQNLPARLRSRRGGRCGYGVGEYGMESGRAGGMIRDCVIVDSRSLSSFFISAFRM